ncbi:TIGR01244 family sulfur transferase [Sedimentitalea todarodis]|uniref:TIGR01244 family sulfur transferase n=1 Tax=Sedimentitalea todarodis TaxID=1631240 RepID=A0ABU3V8L8_9RHOB|nr:TIGR01244 family sulfur transferase [Sedimentitalea todarodis]MDU9002511.1 TIGR01244 family sulfur transferase [Sedimentitalea todarodis]
MDLRNLSPVYAVSPQISVEDVPAIVEAGITLVICNRPDSEVPPSHQADAIGEAVREAGLRFEVLPLTHQTMTPENVARQAGFVESAGGPVLAYCASGTRCSVIWALGQAATRTADDVLADTSAAGYQLDGLRPTLEQLHQS